MEEYKSKYSAPQYKFWSLPVTSCDLGIFLNDIYLIHF